MVSEAAERSCSTSSSKSRWASRNRGASSSDRRTSRRASRGLPAWRSSLGQVVMHSGRVGVVEQRECAVGRHRLVTLAQMLGGAGELAVRGRDQAD